MQDGGREALSTPDSPGAPTDGTVLCRLDEIEDPGSRGFEDIEGEAPFFVVRRGAEVFAYRNSCPHYNAPLDWKPHAFLSYKKDYIMCSMHAARFRFEDGVCIDGPCPGQSLETVDVLQRDGEVVLLPARK